MEYDIEFVRGDTFIMILNFENLDNAITGMYFSCKTSPLSTSYIFQKTLNDGITLLSDGSYQIKAVPNDTANATGNDYYYDVQVTIGTDIYTILIGKLTIVQDITKE